MKSRKEKISSFPLQKMKIKEKSYFLLFIVLYIFLLLVMLSNSVETTAHSSPFLSRALIVNHVECKGVTLHCSVLICILVCAYTCPFSIISAREGNVLYLFYMLWRERKCEGEYMKG